MTYQEYLKLANKLIAQKDALYGIASHKLSNNDKAGAQRIYTEVDEVQKELDVLVNPQDQKDQIATNEELTLNFDS